MEKLKDPAMLLAVANSIGIVGTTAYFYKQLESLRLEIVKLSQATTAVVRKVAEIDKGHNHNNEALHGVGEQLKGINETLAELASLDKVEDIDVDIEEIICALANSGIEVERPSQSRRRSGDRRPPPRRVDDEDRRDERREPTRRYGKPSSFVNSDRQTNSRDDLRLLRGSTRDKPNQRTEPPSNYDDEDLINAVRNRQDVSK